jgi:hypothetical protein
MFHTSLCFATLLALARGYPYKWITTSPKDLTTIAVGDSASFMGINAFIAGTGGLCVVDMSATFAGSSTYQVKVTATTASAIVLQVDAGSFTATGAQLVGTATPARKISNTKNSAAVTSAEFLWSSPTSGTANFEAVCISSYAGSAWKSDRLTSTFDANAMIPVNDFTGYIVDKFCWDKPNHIAIDGSDLANDPKRHTLHCLWEVPQCRNSGYFLLELDSPTKKYVKKYTLDAASNTKAVALLEAMFKRDTGSGNNVKVTVSGTVSSAGVLTTTKLVEIESTTTITPSPSSSGSGTVNTDGATLHSDLTVSAIVSADKTTVDFILTSKRNAWVAFGVTNPTGGGMTGSGKGSDVVICMKGGAAQRFAITTKATPTGGVEMAGSSCTFANGGVVMKFSRKVVAADDSELALTPGTAQALIWALGAVGDVDLSARHDARGETSIDVAAMSAGGKIELKAPNWALWLHIICMGSAWGLLLPWGVAIANRLRNVEKDEYPGGWFYLHKKLQYIGWFLQLLGFIFVVVYVAMEGGAHFSNPHMILGLVVTILGTLQPLNALFRPHPPVAGEEKSKGRVMWEYLHKGSGWIAVHFGMLNVFLGALLTNVLGFNASPLVLGMIIGVLGLLTVGCFLICSCVSPNNGWSVFCIRLTPKKKEPEGAPAVPCRC